MSGRRKFTRVRLLAAAGLALAAPAMTAPAHAAFSAPSVKPPAPGPAYLSRLDQMRLKTIHDALDRQEFAIAKAELKFIDDETARGLGWWLYFMAKDPNVSFVETGAFLDAHPDWPALARIQSYAEANISDDDPADAVLAFFKGRRPRTGEGQMQLARALLAKGRDAEATREIRDAWINHNFRIADERRILDHYGARLTKDDHAARVDRLLWGLQVTNARRTFPYLDRTARRLAETRAALLLRAATAERLFNGLPEKLRTDSGVLYAAVRYYRRQGEEPTAVALADLAPRTAEDLRNTDRWWTERRILLQWALREGRVADAYRLAARHGMTEGGDFADAEFVAGWIALRFLNEPDRARTHFEAMTGGVGTPISLSRGHYWIARAAEAAGDKETAEAFYRSAAEHHYSYYGQLAAEALGESGDAYRFAPPPAVSAADRARFNARPAVAAMRMLTDLDLDYEFMVFAYHVDGELETPGEFAELARYTNGEGAPHLTVRAGKVATQNGAFAADVSYPMVFVPEEARSFVRPEIILGLSRQESEFNPRAFSSAGARGVMQLMPTTAQITAKKEGLPYNRSALLDDPVYNMTIGAAHLSHLIDRFDGSLIMTFAAYNAGAHRVDQWVEDFGDPRTGEVDPVDWVELIPFSETRNYVQRVLENVQVYRGRLEDAPIPGRLAADLEAGGPKGRAAALPFPTEKLARLAARHAGEQPLPALPAETVRLATAFRQARFAAITEAAATNALDGLDDANAAAETIGAPGDAAPDGPARGGSRQEDAPAGGKPAPFWSRLNRASRTDPGAAITPAPAPATSNPPIAAPAETGPDAAPVSMAAEAGPSAKTDNLTAGAAAAPVLAPVLAPAVAANVANGAPEPAADETTDAATMDQATADEPETTPAIDAPSLNDAAPAPSETNAERMAAAAKMVRKAATRLQITDEGDALAAAIARGLAQLEDAAPATAAEDGEEPADLADAAAPCDDAISGDETDGPSSCVD